MKNKRIAFFVRSFPRLSETFILNQIIGLIDLGYDVEIISLHDPKESKVQDSYYDYNLKQRTIYLNCEEHSDRKLRFLSRLSSLCINTLKGRLKNSRYCVNSRLHPYLAKSLYLCRFLNTPSIEKPYNMIIAHFGPDASLAVKLRELGIFKGPIASVFHGFDMSDLNTLNLYRSSYEEVFEKGELMLPISNLWQRRLIKWGCNSSKILVHRMGVDIDSMPARAHDTQLNRPLRVACVGRMTEKKGIPFAIQGVALASQSIKIELNIVGGGETLDEMKQLVTSLDANDYIRCHGPQTQDFVKQILANSDVFLLPSVTAEGGDMEGIPVALMESMASGLITLSTHHSGIPELISDGISGFLTDEKSPDQIAQKLVAISDLSPESLMNIRTAARKKIEEEYNNSKLHSELAEIISRSW